MIPGVMRALLLPLLIAAASAGQDRVVHEGSPGLRLTNGALELIVAPDGGAVTSLTLEGDGPRTNLLWDPARLARERGREADFGPSKGHFLCVDGFGPPSAAERAAGLMDHGEANKLPWTVLRSSSTSVTFQVSLPLAGESLVRTLTLLPGEPVVVVESELTSELPFDRVLLWAEHATIGAPFLALGRTAVDQSARRCRTKSYDEPGPARFPQGKEFEWPSLDGVGDLRVAPAKSGRMDHIGCLMDESRDDEFLTAIQLDENLLIGYLFRRRDYPWVQHWMYYPEDGAYAWGLEFGMQPYDATKEEVVALSPLFGTPTFRWLPAKSKLSTRFLMFAAKVPPGFDRVTDVRVGGGKIRIVDGPRSLVVELAYSGEW
jgi:hypothetical protein